MQSGPVLRVILCYSHPCPRPRLKIWSRETGSAVSSRVNPLVLQTQTEFGAYSRDSSRFPRRHPFICIFNHHRVSPEFVGSRNCVPMMAFTAETPPPQDQSVVFKVVRVTGAAFSGILPRANFCAPLFSHTHCWYSGYVRYKNYLYIGLLDSARRFLDRNTLLLIILNSVCVCVCFLPTHSGHQVRWTYQPGSHRRKVTQDFSSTFFLRCVP